MKTGKVNREFNIVFANGSRRSVVIPPGVLTIARRFAGEMSSLFEGTGFNPLNADVSNIVAVTRADHDIMHQACSGQRKADFRLGQMDMQVSVCDMLRAMANGAAEGIRPGLTLAADLVESMEVDHADS